MHTARVNGLCFDSLSNVAYSISQDKLFRVSHGTSLALVQGVPHKEPLTSMWHDAVNKRLFVANKIGEIFIYDISHVLVSGCRHKSPR